jgi:hypothetical protein
MDLFDEMINQVRQRDRDLNKGGIEVLMFMTLVADEARSPEEIKKALDEISDVNKGMLQEWLGLEKTVYEYNKVDFRLSDINIGGEEVFEFMKNIFAGATYEETEIDLNDITPANQDILKSWLAQKFPFINLVEAKIWANEQTAAHCLANNLPAMQKHLDEAEEAKNYLEKIRKYKVLPKVIKMPFEAKDNE